MLAEGVQAGHEDGMVEGADHEHVELAAMCGSEVDQLGIPPPVKMVGWGQLWGLPKCGGLEDTGGAGIVLVQDLGHVGEGSDTGD